MSTDIGSVYNTEIPELADAANIQKALIGYHYGDPNIDTTTVTLSQFNPVNDVPHPSIAGYLRDLQLQIDNVSGQADIPASVIKNQSDLLGAVSGPPIGGVGTAGVIPPPTSNVDGSVLTFDSTYTSVGTGIVPKIKWSQPQVTLSNEVVLNSKSLNLPKIVANSGGTDTGSLLDHNGLIILQFTDTASASAYVDIANSTTAPVISAAGSATNINLALSGKGSGKVTIGGSEVVTLTGTQTLTNKTISSLISGSFTLSFPSIGANDTVVTNNTSAELASKTILVSDSGSSFKDTGASNKVFSLRANANSGTTTIVYMPPIATAGASDTLVGVSATQTLTNKTLTSPSLGSNGSLVATGSVTLASGASTIALGSTPGTTVTLGQNTTTNVPAFLIGSRKVYIQTSNPGVTTVGGTTYTPASGDIWIKV